MRPETCDLRPATCNLQPATCIRLRAARYAVTDCWSAS